MNKVYTFKLGEKEVLGFDTGLNAKAFAQAKMAQFISQQGCVVYPEGSLAEDSIAESGPAEGRIELWKAEGVEEHSDGNMVIYGPAFYGENLMEILSQPERKEEALDAVRFWIKARILMEKEGKASPFPGAAGAFIVMSSAGNYPQGTLLFPPERIVKRCLEAAGDEAIEAAQRWVHPDLYGSEDSAFSAAAMLYAVFCGAPPFTVNRETNLSETTTKKTDGQSDLEILRQDIREGVFLPPELAAPGLDKELSSLLKETLGTNSKKADKKRPSLEALLNCIGGFGSGKTVSWFKTLEEEETKKIIREREQYIKTKNLKVKTRRFVIRNTSIIVVCAAVVLGLIIGVRSYINHQAEKPSTRGMSPVQVVETYYGAFGPLEHTVMEACVINKAGKEDINMVINLFVLTKVRQAYEFYQTIDAQQWLDEGSPETLINVFGVTDLKTSVLYSGESSGEVHIEANYILWVPAGFLSSENEKPLTMEEITESRTVPALPVSLQNRDRLKLVLRKDAWRIAEIIRAER